MALSTLSAWSATGKLPAPVLQGKLHELHAETSNFKAVALTRDTPAAHVGLYLWAGLDYFNGNHLVQRMREVVHVNQGTLKRDVGSLQHRCVHKR